MKPKPEETKPPPDAAAGLDAAKVAALHADIAADLAALPGPPPPPAMEVLARVMAAGTNEETRKLLGVDDISPMEAFKDFGRESTLTSRNELNAALRKALADILKLNAAKLAPAVVDVLRRWTKAALIEGLAEWLGKGGWDKVQDVDKVEARLVSAARAYATERATERGAMFAAFDESAESARAYAAQAGKSERTLETATAECDAAELDAARAYADARSRGEYNAPGDLARAARGAAAHAAAGQRWPGIWSFCWPKPDRVFLACYSVPCAKEDTVKDRGRAYDPGPIARLMKPDDWPKLPDPVPVLVGLAALKAGMECLDWGGLALCLTDKAGKDGDWLRLLAVAWLEEEAAQETESRERESNARRLAVRTVKTSAGKYARLPKLAAGISWAFGGAGVKLPEGYKAAPNMAALVPPGYALLRDTDLAKPHQAALPLLVDGDDSPPLVLAVTGASRDVFTPAAAWLAVYVMAATWDKPEVLQETSLRGLTRAIYPDATRLQGIHFKAVADALNMMRSARILWPNGYADALFYVPRWTWKTPNLDALDEPLVVGIDQHFLSRTLPDISAATGIKSLKGQFVFNLTGTMNLDKNRAGLLRQYLRAVATGDAFYEFKTGKPAPDLVPEVDAVRWATLTNYLPNNAVRELQGKDRRPVGRVAKSKAMKRMLADIDTLADLNMVKVARADQKAVKLLLSSADLEAWQAFRDGKHRLR